MRTSAVTLNESNLSAFVVGVAMSRAMGPRRSLKLHKGSVCSKFASDCLLCDVRHNWLSVIQNIFTFSGMRHLYHFLSKSIVLHFLLRNGRNFFSNHLWSSRSAFNSQVSCLNQLRQILSVLFYLECHLDAIFQQHLIKNYLQQYLYHPEPTAILIILCCCHLDCFKLKGLC